MNSLSPVWSQTVVCDAVRSPVVYWSQFMPLANGDLLLVVNGDDGAMRGRHGRYSSSSSFLRFCTSPALGIRSSW